MVPVHRLDLVQRTIRYMSQKFHGPGLKDFLVPPDKMASERIDNQWDKAPYLQDRDVSAAGRKGRLH